MTYTEYLCHHGILGQKWGKKNGPPYPIAPGSVQQGKIYVVS